MQGNDERTLKQECFALLTQTIQLSLLHHVMHVTLFRNILFSGLEKMGQVPSYIHYTRGLTLNQNLTKYFADTNELCYSFES